MSQHPIDKLFHDKLASSQVDPPMHVWERVASQRQQRKRGRPWHYLGAGLVAMLMIWLLLPQYFAPTAGLPVDSFQIEPATPEVAPATPLPAPPELSAEALLAPPNESVPQRVNPASVPAVRRTSAAPARRVQSPSTPPTPAATSPTTNSPATRAITPPNPVAPAGEPTRLQRPNPALLQPEVSPAAEPSTNRPAGPHQRDRQHSSALAPLPAPTGTPALLQPLLSNRTVGCVRFKPQRHHFDLDVMAGPARAEHSWESRTSESNEHLIARQLSENPALSFGGMVRVSAINRNGFAIRVGLSTTHIRDRFTYTAEGESRLVITERYNSEGQIIGRDSSMIADMVRQRMTNRLHTVEVPLLLGYEFKVNRFRFIASAGVAFNLAFGAQGKFLNPTTQEPVAFGQEGDAAVVPIYPSRISSSWYFSMGALYHLGGPHSLLIEPYFQQYPHSLTRPEYILRQQTHLLGLQLGLRTRL